MEVIVKSANEVLIDGTPVGNVADAFLNFRAAAGAIYDGLIAYERGLRDQIAGLQGDLKTALEEAEKAKIDAETAVQKAAGDAATAIETAKSEAGAAVETARAAMQSQVDQKFAEAGAAVAAAQADAQKANADRTFAQQLQQLHWQQVQALMSNQTEAAVAVLKEIQKMEVIDETARLDARRAALGA